MDVSRRNLLAAGAGLSAAGVLGASADAAKMIGPVASVADFGVVPNLHQDQSLGLQRAIDHVGAGHGQLFVPPGFYITGNLHISSPLHLTGVPGQSRIVFSGQNTPVQISGTKNVTLSGLEFDGSGHPMGSRGLVNADNVLGLVIERCSMRNSSGAGIDLRATSGRIFNSSVSQCRSAGIFSIDSPGLDISHNHVHDIADNGILIWQSEPREDGSIVAFNKIERIAARSGGDGPYGNAINVYRAGNVSVTGNRITDCAFSAVRNNAGSNALITANACSRTDEVAIFVEFAFKGAVVAGNMIDTVAMGISITNFNHGGRMAVCANNVVRDVLGARSNPNTGAVGIAVEADTAVTGNVIDNAPRAGLWLGWGAYMRNIAATGNVVRGCGMGIVASVSQGAGQGLIANNVISQSRDGAIIGADHDKVQTSDLARPGADVPDHLSVIGNLVS